MPNALLDQQVVEAWVSGSVSAVLDQLVVEAWVPVGNTIVSVVVTPATATIIVHGTQQYTVVGITADGNSVDITASTVWSTSNTAFATITSAGGLATGVSRGVVTIIATFGLLIGTAQLNVSGMFRSDGWVTAATGVSIPNAAVYVSKQPTTTSVIPPSNLAPIFSDPGGIAPVVQPVLTDALGHYDFYILPGAYTVVISINNQVSHVYPDQSIGRIGS